MNDDPKKPGGPPERPTTQLPKVDIPSMLTSLAADMKQVLNATDKMSSDVDMLISDGRKTNQRLTRVEERLDDFDGRLMRNSSRVKEPSQHDLAAAAELANERTAREALATEVAFVKTEVSSVKTEVSEVKEVNQQQSAKLASIENSVEDVKGAVIGVIRDPKVKAFAKFVFTLAMGYAAARGIKVLP